MTPYPVIASRWCVECGQSRNHRDTCPLIPPNRFPCCGGGGFHASDCPKLKADRDRPWAEDGRGILPSRIRGRLWTAPDYTFVDDTPSIAERCEAEAERWARANDRNRPSEKGKY